LKPVAQNFNEKHFIRVQEKRRKEKKRIEDFDSDFDMILAVVIFTVIHIPPVKSEVTGPSS
jgi:hypothetical protein